MHLFVLVSLISTAIVPAFAQTQSKGNSPPVYIEGNAFYTGNDERFYMRGVAYQPGGASDARDPLLDIPSLKRDIANFKELGVNTIRIYTVDNSQNHDEGMQLLDEAGIYLALDVNTPKYSINRATEDSAARSYNTEYMQSVLATVDNFADYNNLLLFFSGNEVINEVNNTFTGLWVKAVTRDMRQYIRQRGPRQIPVGYSAADVSTIIWQQAHYFDCGSATGEFADARADFFAFNDYSWCDFPNRLQTFEGAGWDKKVEQYKDFPTPIFLSEHGCIEPNRQWGEVAAIFSERMSSVYSGGLAYEYTVEPNGYGLVEIQNGEVTTNEDFDELKAAFAAVTNPTGRGGAKQNGVQSECPGEEDDWPIPGNVLPATPSGVAEYIANGPGRGPGLAGPGSQNSGPSNPPMVTMGSGSGSPSATSTGSQPGATGAAAAVRVPGGTSMGALVVGVVAGVAMFA